MIVDFFFWLFAGVLLISASLVVSSRNTVHSVLFLILSFFNAASLFLIAGAEFLALILVIVYVGAVAVLFMFVVMMLDIDFEELRGGLQRYAGIGAAVGVALLAELTIALGGWKLVPDAAQLRLSPIPAGVGNTEALGLVLYTDYILLFQIAGLVLLVAMMGAIVLTLRDRKTSRHQIVSVQTSRTIEETLEIVTLSLGAGTTESGGFLRPKQTEPEPELEPEAANGRQVHD
jgi:NADH-quinone oxidoreductase subunit J